MPVAVLHSDWCGYSSPYFLVLPDKHPSIKKEFMGILQEPAPLQKLVCFLVILGKGGMKTRRHTLRIWHPQRQEKLLPAIAGTKPSNA